MHVTLNALRHSLSIETHAQGSSPLLPGWPDELLEVATLQRFDRHDVVQREGAEPTHVYIVVLGKVLRERASREGTRVVLDVHAKGEVLGLAGFLDGAKHPDSVIAHTRGAVLAIPRDTFQRFLSTHPEARRELDRQLANRVRQEIARSVGLATERVEVRIRTVLADLAERFGAHGDVRGVMLDLGLTRSEVASLCGTTLETVIRTVNRLREQNLLDTDGRRFFFPDVAQLRLS